MAKADAGFPELLMQAKISNRLLAAQLRAAMGQQDMVRLLSSTGATHQEIADVLDTTAATVATTLQRLKKKAIKRSAGLGAEDEGHSGGTRAESTSD
jgi:DNA-directed RNA polymerase specialized sigma24 family protein